MSATIYFGAPAKSLNTVGKEIRALGLEYDPESPSKVPITAAVDYIQPGYALFKTYLATHVKAASEKIAISTRQSIYHPTKHNQIVPILPAPKIIWSYTSALTPEMIDDKKNKFNAKETKARGKVAFEATFNGTGTWWTDLKSENGLNRNTPSTSTNMNISSYIMYIFALRLMDAVLRVNQYPAFKTNDKTDISRMTIGVDPAEKWKQVDVETLMDDGTRVTSKEDQTVPLDTNLRIHANLPHDFAAYSYMITSDAHLPTGFTGVYLPYVSELTTPDFSILPRVFSNYFLGFLGNNRDQAFHMLDQLKSMWGTVCKTEHGAVMAHVLRVIEIAFACQGTIRLVKPTGHSYGGAVILGGLFTLKVWDRLHHPVDRTELLSQIHSASPHQASLDFIFNNIYYADDAARNAAKASVRNVRDVSFQIRSHGVVEAQRKAVVEKAYLLSFAGEKELLSPTAHNIVEVLTAISNDAIPESSFPMHPEAVLEESKAGRLLSAFGIEVPSFLVPGGKKMSLNGNFSVKTNVPGAVGQAAQQTIHKIAVIGLPLADALRDLETVRKDQYVLNPYGNMSAARVSTAGIVRTFEKDSADSIVVALRAVSGASQNVAGRAKRGRGDDEDDDEAQKKLKVDLGLDDI